MSAERLNRITIEQGKCGGRPCIRGLRIRVSDVLDLLAAGASYEEILTDYPFLVKEDILAAMNTLRIRPITLSFRRSLSLAIRAPRKRGLVYS